MAGKLDLKLLRETMTDFEKSCKEIYDEFIQHKSIEEIAEERNLTVNDIDEILREIDPNYDEK